VVAAVLALVLVRTPAAVHTAGPAGGALVDHTTLVCPETGPVARGGGIDVGSAPVPRLDGEGRVRVGPPGDDGRTMALARGALVRAGAAAGTTALNATGASAAGLFGYRAAQDGRATAVAPCLAPRASWWFTGAGAGLDHGSELRLTNVDPGPAVVDIHVLGPDGEVETVGTRGVTLAPGETRSTPLTEIAPQNDELVVHVEASRGRVAAAVLDSYAARAAGPIGSAWLGGTVEPARRLRLAGVAEEGSTRTLVLGNPSESEALVELEVSGLRGTFVPTGFETLTVPPRSVRVVDAEQFLAGAEAGSLELTAQVPIVAAVRTFVGGDTSYASPVRPLDEPAVAPVLERSRTTLQLTAGVGGATVRVAGYSASGEVVDEQRVRVDPAATTTWRAPRDAAYLMVTPTRGNVLGAATYSGAGGADTVLLQPLPVHLERPVVVPGPR
jgi:hypothetical protein